MRRASSPWPAPAGRAEPRKSGVATSASGREGKAPTPLVSADENFWVSLMLCRDVETSDVFFEFNTLPSSSRAARSLCVFSFPSFPGESQFPTLMDAGRGASSSDCISFSGADAVVRPQSLKVETTSTLFVYPLNEEFEMSVL